MRCRKHFRNRNNGLQWFCHCRCCWHCRHCLLNTLIVRLLPHEIHPSYGTGHQSWRSEWHFYHLFTVGRCKILDYFLGSGRRQCLTAASYVNNSNKTHLFHKAPDAELIIHSGAGRDTRGARHVALPWSPLSSNFCAVRELFACHMWSLKPSSLKLFHRQCSRPNRSINETGNQSKHKMSSISISISISISSILITDVSMLVSKPAALIANSSTMLSIYAHTMADLSMLLSPFASSGPPLQTHAGVDKPKRGIERRLRLWFRNENTGYKL